MEEVRAKSCFRAKEEQESVSGTGVERAEYRIGEVSARDYRVCRNDEETKKKERETDESNMDRSSLETSSLPSKASAMGRTSLPRRETLRFGLLVR